jgi:hypothetical protein
MFGSQGVKKATPSLPVGQTGAIAHPKYFPGGLCEFPPLARLPCHPRVPPAPSQVLWGRVCGPWPGCWAGERGKVGLLRGTGMSERFRHVCVAKSTFFPFAVA